MATQPAAIACHLLVQVRKLFSVIKHSSLVSPFPAEASWGEALEDPTLEHIPGDWGASLARSPPAFSQPRQLSPSSTLNTKPHTLPTTIQRPTSSQSFSFSDGGRSDPVHSRRTSPIPVVHTTSTVGMSKEEKAAEMARRKEERKQVCAYYRLKDPHIH